MRAEFEDALERQDFDACYQVGTKALAGQAASEAIGLLCRLYDIERNHPKFKDLVYGCLDFLPDDEPAWFPFLMHLARTSKESIWFRFAMKRALRLGMHEYFLELMDVLIERCYFSANPYYLVMDVESEPIKRASKTLAGPMTAVVARHLEAGTFRDLHVVVDIVKLLGVDAAPLAPVLVDRLLVSGMIDSLGRSPAAYEAVRALGPTVFPSLLRFLRDPQLKYKRFGLGVVRDAFEKDRSLLPQALPYILPLLDSEDPFAALDAAATILTADPWEKRALRTVDQLKVHPNADLNFFTRDLEHAVKIRQKKHPKGEEVPNDDRTEVSSEKGLLSRIWEAVWGRANETR